MEYVYELDKKENWRKIKEWLIYKKYKIKETPEKIIVYFDDYSYLYKFDKFVKAVNADFDIKICEKIFYEDWDIIEYDLRQILKMKINHLKRIIGRLVGEKGKTIREVETISGAYISLKNDRYLYIIGDFYSISTATAIINKIIGGSPHQRAYKFGLEYKKRMDYKKKEEKYIE